jgi:hypothetical protein
MQLPSLIKRQQATEIIAGGLLYLDIDLKNN